MRKLWGRLNSINVQKVAWCLGELGLAYDLVEAGGVFGVVDTPAFRRLNPNGLVPVLEEEDGFALYESNTILRYLSSVHGVGSLWPTDPRVRAGADLWLDWQATTFYPAMAPAFMGLVRTPPEQRDEAAIAASLARGEAMAEILDAHLADRPYVAGDTFTMGDIAAGAIVHRWLNMPGARMPRSHVERWYGTLTQRPAMTFMLGPVT